MRVEMRHEHHKFNAQRHELLKSRNKWPRTNNSMVHTPCTTLAKAQQDSRPKI